MSRSKKIFALFAIAFFFMLAYVVYDISSRTTFPGQKPSTNEEFQDLPSAGDSTQSPRQDSI
ncbi:MAG TPA: hypothetical protein VFO54_06255 [Chryseosolibacter sp.]|nr:hypothetical protein [Chryseosolibacter sp.]